MLPLNKKQCNQHVNKYNRENERERSACEHLSVLSIASWVQIPGNT